MICAAPKTSITSQYYFRCRRCLPCLIDRRRAWTARLLLESFQHRESCFATLTYSDEKRPKDGSVVVRHYQGFLKRLRRSLGEKVRFFLSAEYGERTQRPHYHAILFGLGQLHAGGMDGQSGVVHDAWNYRDTGGFTYVGSVTPESCAYVAGYVTKKLGGVDYGRREKEFTRMSLRPGIGFGAVGALHSALSGYGRYALSLAGFQGLPYSLRFGMSGVLPIGSYVREKLAQSLARVSLGDLYSKDPRQTCLEMQALRQSYASAAKGQERSAERIRLDERSQKVLNVASRYKLSTIPKGYAQVIHRV